MDEPRLTTPQVAAIFQVTDQTVRNWADTGKVPHIKTPGGRYLFRREDIDALLDPSPAEVAG